MSFKISTNTLIVLCILLGIVIGPTVTYLLATYTGMNISTPTPTPPYYPPTPTPTPSGKISVTRHIDWQVIDKYGGGGIANVYIYVYDEGLHKLEGDGSAYKTATDGTYESGRDYASGTILKVELVKSNAKAWYTVVVPEMQAQDAEALTYNPVQLDFYAVIGVTTAPSFTLYHGGTAISDAGSYNKTTSGDTATFTFSIHCNDDNTGYIESYDPLNNINWYAVVYLKQSGTNYADISLEGWDGSYEKGSAMWYHKRITANGPSGITKYKIGNSYEWVGSWGFSFTGDFTGYSGDACDWDIDIYIHSDPKYREVKSSFGPDAVQLGSTFDVDIED